MKCLGASSLVTILWLFLASQVSGEPPQQQKPLPKVHLAKFHSLGSPVVIDPRTGLTDLDHFRDSLREFLIQSGVGKYQLVEGPWSHGSDSVVRLEGEFSRIHGVPRSSYFVVLRLSDSQGTPLAQWAGRSRSIRKLTSNLERGVQHHPQGLVGELGTEISLGLVCATQSAEHEVLERAALKTPTELLSSQLTEDHPSDSPSFRVQVYGRGSGEIYVLTTDKSHVHTIYADTSSHSNLSVKSIVLPSSGSFEWDSRAPSNEQQVFVLMKLSEPIESASSTSATSGESPDFEVFSWKDTRWSAASSPSTPNLIDSMRSSPELWLVSKVKTPRGVHENR